MESPASLGVARPSSPPLHRSTRLSSSSSSRSRTLVELARTLAPPPRPPPRARAFPPPSFLGRDRPSNFLRSSAMRTTLWNNCAGRYFRLLFSPPAAAAAAARSSSRAEVRAVQQGPTRRGYALSCGLMSNDIYICDYSGRASLPPSTARAPFSLLNARRETCFNQAFAQSSDENYRRFAKCRARARACYISLN